MAVNTNITAYQPLGANFYQADTTQRFRLGEKALGANNSEWEYVQNASSSVAINAYELVGYNSDYKAQAVVSSATSDAAKYRNAAFAQVSIPASGYGWVCRRASGGIQGKGVASCAANAQLYVGASGVSAGVLQGASATNTVKVEGVVFVTAIGSTGTNSAEIIANYPRFGAVS
jgi:hypothetical protein